MKRLSAFAGDLYNLTVGFLMGAANVIPGVSGGTMLFITGAFEKLITALREVASGETFKMVCKFDFKGLYRRIQWRFLFGLILGVLLSFATLAKLVVWLLEEHKQLTFAFFFGLIAASIISINRQIKKWSTPVWISFAVSGAIAFGVISLVPVNSGSQWYMMMLYGAICIIAMILPGLSGSFLLLIFGQYARVWDAVGNIARLQFCQEEIVMVVFLAIGCAIGLGAFVHLLNYVMKNFHDATIAALLGFMVGSMPRIWPFQHDDLTSMVIQKGKLVPTRIVYELPQWDIRLFYVLLLVAAGLLLVLAIDFAASKKQRKG